jgi:hypothetical protein
MFKDIIEIRQPQLIRRLRVLLHAKPILELRTLNLVSDSDIFHYDSITLAMFLLDYIIESTGLGSDADSNATIDVLEPMMREMDIAANIEPNRGRHEQFVRKIIDRLRENSETEYIDFDGTQAVRRKLEFRVIKERWASDERVVLELSAEAINLFLNALDLEIEDAQAALEAVIQSQLERGRFDEATASAKDARFRSLQFEDKIERRLRETRRDVAKVDWSEFMPKLLRETLVHVDGRLRIEKHIADVARERLDDLDLGSREASQVALIAELMDDCSDRHVRLHGKLIDARDVFFTEQSRQSFAPRRLTTHLPSLFTDVLEPLLSAHKLTALEMLENSDDSFEGGMSPLFGARKPEVFSLKGLVSWLLRPHRADVETSVYEEQEIWSPPMPDALRYPPEIEQAAQYYINHLPMRLSALLENAASAGENQAVLEHLCLNALLAFDSDSTNGLNTEPMGLPFAQNGFWGDDVELREGRQIVIGETVEDLIEEGR